MTIGLKPISYRIGAEYACAEEQQGGMAAS